MDSLPEIDHVTTYSHIQRKYLALYPPVAWARVAGKKHTHGSVRKIAYGTAFALNTYLILCGKEI